MRYLLFLFLLISVGGCFVFRGHRVASYHFRAYHKGISRLQGVDHIRGNYGRINAVWQNPQTILAASAHGGLWKTNNPGRNWQCLTDSLEPVGISDFIVWEQPHLRIVAANSLYTNYHPVKRFTRSIVHSSDTGKTWQDAKGFDTENQAYIASMCREGDKAWAASAQAIWQSRDRGNTWQELKCNADRSQSIRELEVRKGKLLVSGINICGLLDVKTGNINAFASGKTGEEYRAHAIWDHDTIRVIHTNLENRSTHIFSYEHTNANAFLHEMKLPSTGRSYVLKAALSPGGKLYAGGIRLFRIADKKQPVLIRNIHVDVRDMAFSGDSMAIIAHDGGVSALSGNKVQAAPLNGNMDHSQVYSIAATPDGRKIYAGCHDAGFFIWDQEKGWRKTLTGDVGTIILDAQHQNRVYCVNNKQLWQSGDGGEHWKRKGLKFAAYNPPLLSNAKYTLLAGSWDLLGRQHKEKSLKKLAGSKKGMVSACANKDSLMYAAWHKKENGEDLFFLEKGTFRGKSWNWHAVPLFDEDKKSRGVVTAIVPHPGNADIVWLALKSDRETAGVYISVDGGRQWYSYAKGLNGRDVYCLYYDNSRDWLWAGTEAGLFVAEGNGDTWRKITCLPNAMIADIDEAPGGLWIATYGKGVWRINHSFK